MKIYLSHDAGSSWETEKRRLPKDTPFRVRLLFAWFPDVRVFTEHTQKGDEIEWSWQDEPRWRSERRKL